jgi:protein involved in polysaccharide export with SLBB domain
MRQRHGLSRALALALVAATLSACAHLHPPWQASAPPATPDMAQGVSAAIAPARQYRVGVGDELRITLAGTEALLGDVAVGSDGTAKLPRAGKETVQGLSLAAIAALVNKGSDAKAKVSLVHPPQIYVVGQVVNPGAIAYRKGLTLGGLIALAGGATYKADLRSVAIKARHAKAEHKHAYDATLPILPGDVVRIEERYF